MSKVEWEWIGMGYWGGGEKGCFKADERSYER